MKTRQQLIINITAMVLGVIVVVGLIAWIVGGMSLAYVHDSIERRREQRQRLFDLRGPQESYRRTLEGDKEVVAILNTQGFAELFLKPDDILSFVLDIEELAARAGVHHILSDRGAVEVVRRQSSVSAAELEELSDEERAAVEDLLARRSRGPEIATVPARRFTIELTGSFEAATKFIGMLEESLPLVMVEATTMQVQSLSTLTRGNATTLPPSLQGTGDRGMSAVVTVRVFLEEEIL